MGCVLLLSMLALTFYAMPISGKIIRNNCVVFSNSYLSFKSAFLALIEAVLNLSVVMWRST